jgi:hypothetical protein
MVQQWTVPTRQIVWCKIKEIYLQIAEKQKIEIDFWKKSKTESSDLDSLSLDNIINKISEAGILLDCIKKYEPSWRWL